jgi:hypothetical protein
VASYSEKGAVESSIGGKADGTLRMVWSILARVCHLWNRVDQASYRPFVQATPRTGCFKLNSGFKATC